MRKFIIPTLIIVLLLLTACNQQPPQTVKGAFIGGTQGVFAQFEAFGVEEESIYTIFDEESLPLEVTLRNKEEFDGISEWEKKNKIELEGISEQVPEGGEETLTFADEAKYTKKVSGVVDREWFANIEYRYKTYLIIPEVCLKEDLTDERVCNVKEAKTYFVSGAPITVKVVEEDTAGKEIVAFKIMVSNAGTGKVTKVGEDFGVRNVLSYSIDDDDWECKSVGKVNEARLDEAGNAEIVCKLKEALPEDHISTKQLELTLDYKYRDLIQEKLRIKQSS